MNVTTFEKPSFVKGQHVELKRRVRQNDYGTIILQIPDAEHMTLVDYVIKSKIKMKLGYLPVKQIINSANENDAN